MSRTHAVAVLAVGMLVFAVACAKKLTDLEPYPCAQDGSCPDGRSCNAERRCVRPEIDSLCRAGETDCTTATNDGRCALGVCGQPCDGSRLTCPPDRVCTVAFGATGEGACLRPCDDATSCPAPLECRQLDVRDGKVVRACVGPGAKSSIGGTCKGTSDCTSQGASLECYAGVCSLPCKTQNDCAPGLLCPPGGGACLLDCTTNAATCDADQSCEPLWKGGQRVCIGKGNKVPACESVVGLAKCDGTCGQGLNAVECSGARCPTGATCGTNPTCQCENARACGTNGQRCSKDTPCSGPWWCEPSLTDIGCNDDVSRIVAGCICKDGRRYVSPCTSQKTCEARCQDECDVVAQDCKDPTKSKCTSVIREGEEHDECVPAPSSPKREGETCTRTNGSAVGQDDCAEGLFCSLASAEPGKAQQYRCRRFCSAPGGGCGDGEICARSRNAIDVLSELAVCRPRCTFPGGDECGPGARCFSNGACFAVLGGSKELDEFCWDESDCRSPLVCDPYRSRCVPSCAGGGCPTGYTCRIALGGEVADAGSADGGTTFDTLPLCVKEGS